MGRPKKLDPIQRARLNLSFNLSDPSQRYVYNYLMKKKGSATKIVTDAVLHSSERTEDASTSTKTIPAPADSFPQPFHPIENKAESETYTAGSYAEPMGINESDFDDLDDALSAFGDA